MDIIQIASLVVALATVVFTTYMLSRQVRQMEHERNALAILDATDRLTSSEVVNVFLQLRDVDAVKRRGDCGVLSEADSDRGVQHIR